MWGTATPREDAPVSTPILAPRAVRTTSGRWVAGVAVGLAPHLRLPVWVLRVSFVVLALAGGVGIVLYVAFWAVLPLESPEGDTESARSADTTRLLALLAVVLGIGLLLAASGVDVVSGVILPVIIAVVGAALVWRHADEAQRDAWALAAGRAAERTARERGRWRVVLGGGLVLLAVIALVATRTSPAQAAQGLAIALLIVGGVVLVAFPWLYRAWREQLAQRRALIREQERAEVAAHVHDSVLQTLTLIQRSATDPVEVARLARAEERALRGWLYAPPGDPDRTLAAAIRHEAATVESAYDTTVEVVAVGDVPLDARLGAVVAAAREAMVNAAKHTDGPVSVFVEAADDRVEVFVRDRGEGFDPEGVPADRLGVRESIVGRMERNGGTATIRSSADGRRGTEVRLLLEGQR
jgi:signal transduction histidine kinase